MSSNRHRYFIQIDDLALARGEDPQLSFSGATIDGLTHSIGSALREDDLHQRWLAKQEEPDDVDPQLGLLDPSAQVSAEAARSRIDLLIESELPHFVIKHRLRLLIGEHWRLHDIR